MRIRTGFVVVYLVAACGAFGSAEESSDGGAPSGDAGAGDTAATETGSGSDAAADGGGACDASRRCIDFESTAHQPPKFGFDAVTIEVDGGMVVGSDGYSSPNALRARSVDDSLTRGEIRFDQLPKSVRIQMKVRPESRDGGGASSAHFLMFFCPNTNVVAAKFAFKDDIALQVAGDGFPLDHKYTVGTWISVDAQLDLAGGTRKLTLTVDGLETKTVMSTEKCVAPFEVRVGSDVTAGAGEFTIGFDDIAVDWQ